MNDAVILTVVDPISEDNTDGMQPTTHGLETVSASAEPDVFHIGRSSNLVIQGFNSAEDKFSLQGGDLSFAELTFTQHPDGLAIEIGEGRVFLEGVDAVPQPEWFDATVLEGAISYLIDMGDTEEASKEEMGGEDLVIIDVGTRPVEHESIVLEEGAETIVLSPGQSVRIEGFNPDEDQFALADGLSFDNFKFAKLEDGVEITDESGLQITLIGTYEGPMPEWFYGQLPVTGEPDDRIFTILPAFIDDSEQQSAMEPDGEEDISMLYTESESGIEAAAIAFPDFENFSLRIDDFGGLNFFSFELF